MKKNSTKKILSSLFAFIMFFNILVGAFPIQTSANRTTNLHITKLKSNSFPNGAIDHDGKKLNLSDLSDPSKLGTTVEGLDGVKFTYWKVDDEVKFKQLLNAPASYDTVDKVKVLLTSNGTETTATSGGGKVDLALEDGNYWFVESEKPETVSSSVAVPFGISLPLTNPEGVGANGEASAGTKGGTLIMTDVYIYPKNIDSELPKVDKSVEEVGRKSSTYNVGEEIVWYLQGTVPKNIYDYTKYEFEDVLDEKISFISVEEVKYADAVVPTTDYTVSTNNNTLKVTLNTEGSGENQRLKYFKDKKTEDGTKQLVVKFKAKINEKAVMGENIKNSLKITFNNTPKNPTADKTRELEENKKPFVVTGGKIFKKVADGTTNGLEDAVFQLFDGATEVKWTDDLIKANKTAIDAGKFSTDANGTATSTANQAQVGQPIYLRSIASGEFEIKGLAFSSFQKQKWDNATSNLTNDGSPVTHDWKLKEVKAPSNYAKIETEIQFTVNATSYTQADEIKNKKLTIPQTGGMGTIIFTVVGLSLMAVALYALKKKESRN